MLMSRDVYCSIQASITTTNMIIKIYYWHIKDTTVCWNICCGYIWLFALVINNNKTYSHNKGKTLIMELIIICQNQAYHICLSSFSPLFTETLYWLTITNGSLFRPRNTTLNADKHAQIWGMFYAFIVYQVSFGTQIYFKTRCHATH